MSDVLERVCAVLAQRKGSPDAASYTSGLFSQGTDAILKKVGEEAAELIIASKNGDDSEFIHELTDLWFHTLVLCVHKGYGLEDILREMESRFGTSGITEKLARKKTNN